MGTSKADKEKIKQLLEGSAAVKKEVADLKITISELVDRPDFNELYAEFKKKNEGIPDVPPVDPCPEGQHRDASGNCVPDTIECPPGQHLENGVCVPDVVVPPEPSGELWYDSDTDGKWSNGHAREFDDYDPDLPKPYQGGKGMITAASGSPHGSIDGRGTFTLSGNGGHPRTYTDAINYTNVVCQYELKFNQAGVNHTNQLQARHQEEDQNEKDNENAFGGYNFEISPNDVGLKIELYHTPSGGDHINGPSKKQSLVKVGEWVRVKNTLKVDVANKSSYQSIELNNQKVIEWTSKNLPDFAVNETKFKQRSYFWNRINPSGNASINIRKQTLSKT